MSGSVYLDELSGMFRVVAKAQHPDFLSFLEPDGADHKRVLLDIFERLPRSKVRVVVDTMAALTDPTYGLPGHETLNAVVRNLGDEPRSYREARRVFDVLSSQLEQSEKLNKLAGQAFELLDENGVLGMKSTDWLARLVHAVDTRRDRWLLHEVRGGTELVMREDRYLLSDLKELRDSLSYHDPLWGRRAASRVLYPATHSKALKKEEVGSSRLSKAHLPVLDSLPFIEKVLPYETLTVDEPSVVLLPTRNLERAKVRFDPIPEQLVQGRSNEELYDFVSTYFDLDRAFLEHRKTLEVIYISVYAFVTVVQSEWIHQLKPVRISLRQASERNYAAYEPAEKQIWISTAPLSAWALLAELAHALDDELWDPPGFASGEGGNPLANFAEVVRPYYASQGQKRAESVYDAMVESAFSGPIEAKTISLSDLMDRAQLDPRLRGLIFQAILTFDFEDAAVRAQVRKLFGFDQGRGRGEMLMMQALSRAIVQDSDGTPLVSVPAFRDAFIELEMAYILAPHELFSRFFSQYTRMYWAQQGFPFGPSSLPGDIGPEQVAELSAMFNDALLRAQELDFKGRNATLEKESFQQKMVAGALSLFGFAKIEGLL